LSRIWSWLRLGANCIMVVPALLVMPVIAVAFGTVGFEMLRDRSDVPDSMYRAVQLLGLNFEAPDQWIEARGGIPLLLGIGRWLAALATFTIVVELVSRSVGAWLRLRAQSCFPRNRVILLGFGDINHAIARSLKARHVTAVDKVFDEADRRMARRRGILLYEGDLADVRTFRNVRIAAASEVYVACGPDEVSLQVARSARRAIRRRPGSRVEVHVHLSNVRFLRDLEDAQDLAFDRNDGLKTFSLKLEAARDLLVRTRLPQRARDSGRDRVHAVICGMGDQGEAALLELALGGHAAGMRPPRITVIDRDAERIEAEFRANYPELTDPSVVPDEARPAIRFKASEIRALDVENDLAWLWDEDAPTAFLIATSDDSLNMSTALRIETAMQRRRLPHVLICVRQWDAVAHGGPAHANPLLHIITFGNSRVTARGWAGRQSQQLLTAKALNAHYEARRDQEDAWDGLADLYRRANLRAVRHGSSRLLDLGLQWRGMATGVLPRVDLAALPELARAMRAPLGRDRPPAGSAEAELWEAARSEHSRWLIDRATSGFRPAHGSRSDVLRRQTLMVDFRDLSEEVRRYDNHLLEVLAQLKNCCAPLALVRRVATIDDAGDPVEGHGDGATELQVRIPDPYRLADAARLAARVQAWARAQTACRLHLLIHDPAEYPRRVEPDALLGVASLVEGLDSGIVCDVTWRSDAAEPHA